MKIRNWKHNPFTYLVTRVKSPHPAHHPPPSCQTNVPDTYSAITQLIAAQHEQMSLSSTSAAQYPITPPTSLLSDDDNDEVFTPLIGNPRPVFTLYTESPTPTSSIIPAIDTHPRYARIPDSRKIVGNPTFFRPYDLPNPSTSTSYDNPLIFR